MIRQPIVVLVGHIDHGKSSILEKVRGLSITKGEAGGITQSLKSYPVPFAALEKFCGPLLKTLSFTITLPGLLFLDTPGHAAFNNMRKRGGNLADIAILVVDCHQGVQEQTLESLTILRQYKTPFILALNKIDTLDGWRSGTSGSGILQTIKAQSDRTQQLLDNALYTAVAKLSDHGFQADRFDRVSDYTNQIALVPVSAKTGEGLPELLMVLIGLAQRYMEKSLQIEAQGPGKGTILEVKEEPGLGKVLDVVLYDGCLQAHDAIVLGTLDKPLVTKVKALFQQQKGSKLVPVKKVYAACGVRVIAPDMDAVVGGMPLRVVHDTVEKTIAEVQSEIEEVLFSTDKEGVIIKADTLGSLEALAGLLRQKNIPVKRAALGPISKKDLADAKAEQNSLYKIILGFNIEPLKTDVKTICHPVIYKIIEDYVAWKDQQAKHDELQELEGLTRPCKMQIMRGCVFRQSNPAVVGVVIQGGLLKTDAPLLKADGSKAGFVKSLQLEGETIQEADKGKEVAVAIPGVIVGRQIKEEDILFTDLTEKEFVKYKQLKKYLKKDEIAVLKEFSELKRKEEPLWGV